MMKSGVAVSFFFLLTTAVAAQTKVSRTLQDNIVKVTGTAGTNKEDPKYGLVVGSNKETSDTLYFILIYSKKQRNSLKKEVNVLFSTEKSATKKDNSAKGIGVERNNHIEIGEYVIALYAAATRHQIAKPFFAAINPKVTDGYKIYDDRNDELNNFYAFLSKHKISKPEVKANGSKQYGFMLDRQDFALARNGLPVVDSNGILIGVAAENQQQRSFSVLDMMEIRNKLARVAGRYECKYFNLIEEGQQRTPCEQLALDVLNNDKRKQAEKDRIDKLSRLERRNERRDRDYLIAVSLGGNLGAGSLRMNNSSGIDLKMGYGFGANIHIRPDSKGLGFTLKPRYNIFEVGLGDYQNEANTSFKVTSIKATSYEVPVMLALTNRYPDGNYFYAIGYVGGIQKITSYTASIGQEDPQSRPVISYPQTIHKGMLEIGCESGMLRYSFWAAYQFSPLLYNDYQIIVDGKYFKPFQEVKTGHYSFGVDVALRLWGRWKNGNKI
ncbi:hypothetical protein [Chitinophaga arvensicola]|uniref:Outer membrane protein beta-barrel domain-containing protein n=1 Tax=Chitinophaga arvensicola TaxID=29529 RepID=A0A1I0S6D7_9BACT|nr:hypothetical protein [Chitinophaga arvensicola]SEW51050.1 hypothetical protein SAMN04488122_4094 [Chitinophaga arvensicola]